MAILHVGAPLRILEVQEDEFLGQPFTYLVCVRLHEGHMSLYSFRDEGETFPDMSDPVTAAYCRLATGDGPGYGGAP